MILIDLILTYLESDVRRVLISLSGVVDGDGKTLEFTVGVLERSQQICGKSGDSTPAWKIIAYRGDSPYPFHRSLCLLVPNTRSQATDSLRSPASPHLLRRGCVIVAQDSEPPPVVSASLRDSFSSFESRGFSLLKSTSDASNRVLNPRST